MLIGLKIKDFDYEYKGVDKIGENYRIAYTIFKFGETEKLKLYDGKK